MLSNTIRNRVSKVAFAFCMALFFMALFLLSTFFLTSKRHIPNTQKEQYFSALRGNIITSDNFTVTSSRQIYRAEIDLRSLNPDKKELFLTLFQIYSSASDEQMQDIKKRMLAKKRRSYNFILLQDINSKDASYLKELAKKLYTQGFFKSFTNNNGRVETRGLDIIEHKEDRVYMPKDSLTPIIGYTRTYMDEKSEIFKNVGIKGLEKYYNECLSPLQNAKIQGLRDIGGNIILNLHSYEKRKIDGCNLYLNISLKLQKGLEKAIDKRNEDLKANEIIVAIMESKSGKILALASSRRYDPQNRGKDLSVLNASAIEYGYEAGSVIKPFIFTTALMLDKIKVNEIINTQGGQYKLGRFTIRDDHRKDKMSMEEVITYSSNVGMIKIAQRLSNLEIISGLRIFRFGERSGIDLPYEQKGEIPNPKRLREVEKSVLSYGYGLKTTFMQLLAAYNVFNNDGIYITPQIANKIYQDGRLIKLDDEVKKEKILSSKAAKEMQQILINVIEKGTGKKAQTQGIIIGGKTGTARIAERKGYTSNRYNASFFGFANDEKNNYTIGVLVRNPTKAYSYYAAQSALPMFKDTVNLMIKESYLKPIENKTIKTNPN
ncbi:cell division protein FtsI/penicillin-binding protein [Campylobacter lari]|uniref:cell division protein FtsI/penicillin-binding protein n=1 Tax=Campylobacter lari TaxID=201 RepID=UPI000580777B|nr:cell division protein FtsI/penicillin-binding protein [Campylobacter lari]AJC89429.1 cell division protein FtsI / penicillin-binding protein [Campylobacter lari subsp. concheus LMG 11760]EAJ0339580.1 cell division protein FtsI/penicillin-binding protein [Campylobacter lari]EAK5889349.1 cell division protein FtsI/penicillin-binding protein [Campylobacter lari]EAK9937812.1 cell division protein FtsI/penicillin-binding protein [Campylobacter lari]EDP6836824.1 cell division protein FtsI/penicil